MKQYCKRGSEGMGGGVRGDRNAAAPLQNTPTPKSPHSPNPPNLGGGHDLGGGHLPGLEAEARILVDGDAVGDEAAAALATRDQPGEILGAVGGAGAIGRGAGGGAPLSVLGFTPRPCPTPTPREDRNFFVARRPEKWEGES